MSDAPLQDETYAFPLSFAQQRLWFLDRLMPGNPFYNIPLAVPVPAPVQVQPLERALNALVDRHESLRTVFRIVDGEVSQVILPKLHLKIDVADLRQLPPAVREERTLELATHEARLPFDLEKGPLIRCGLVTRGPADHVLLLTMHHIISDGWSMGILARELTALYGGFVSGFPVRLPELPVQYADFTMWQRERLQGEALDELLSYWRTRLDGLEVLDLPTDRPRPPVITFRGAFHPVTIPAPLAQAVRRFAMEHHATPFMVLTAAFAALLHRYSGQTDLAIGTPLANRNRAEIEGLIGFFVNSLVLRVSAAGDPSFTELLSRTKEVAVGAYAHEDLPFEKLVEELQPVRDPSRNPLFQVTFQLIDFPTMQKAASTALNIMAVQRGTAIFDIAFTLTETATGFTGLFEYSTDLFEAETMVRFDAHFQRLLAAAVSAPDTPLSALPLLDDEEREEELRRSCGPVGEVTDDAFVHRAVAAQATRTPDAVAVQASGGELTYRDVVSRARRLAQRLRQAGVTRGTPVGILIDRSLELPVALLAVLEAGGAYVPLDPAYPAERLRYMLADSNAPVIVTHEPHAAEAEELAAGRVRVVLSRDGGEGPSPAPLASVTRNDLAYILYTSGSTGRPKGVAISHGALANHMQWMLERFPLTASDRVLQRTPYAFDASVWELFAPLMSGARLVMLPQEAHRNSEATVAEMSRRQITVVQAVPALLRVMLDEPGLYACSSLRRIFAGGEALSDALRAKVTSTLGVELVNLYGPTEATIDTTYFVCGDREEPFGVPIGEPVLNTRAYVLDERFDFVPRGVEGELHLAGPQLARGYFGRPGLTAERFVPDPHSSVPGARMYRTGDRVRRLPGGQLLFTGRTDEQVKVRGFRIEPGEIETLICNVPGVKNCVVVADTSRGEASALTAFLVPDTAEADAGAGEMAGMHVSHWEEIYELIYGDLSPAADATLDTVGWNSSYTGLPIPVDEMSAWRDETVARIRALRPRRVLEIGCGTGMLLTRLAADCDRYVATDFCGPLIRQLRARLEAMPEIAGRTTLLCRAADDFSGLESGSFDAVILNSVVQYFPGPDYLADVVRGAARLLAPGGAIFAGDLRSLPLLEAFELSLARHRAPHAGAEELRQQVRLAVEQEQELVLDPRFFARLAGELGGRAEISIKRGWNANELTRFRYDAVVRLEETTHAEPRRVDWTREGLTVDALLAWLACEQPERLIVEGIPNARVAAEVAWLGETEPAADAVDPESLWCAAESLGYDVRIRFSAPPRAGCVDLVLRQPGTSPVHDAAGEDGEELRALTNNPLRGAMTRRLASRVREAIAAQLPEHMVPSVFALTDALPLLPSGKIDRAAVAKLRVVRAADEGTYGPPRTPLEEALCAIWSEVLDVPRVGIRDDFFTDHGGHSLLATRLISRIRSAFRIDVPLKQIFATSSVEAFAAVLLEGAGDPERRRIEGAAELLVKLSRMSEAEVEQSLRATEAMP